MKRRGNVEDYNYNYRDSFHLFVAAEFDAGRVTVVTAAAYIQNYIILEKILNFCKKCLFWMIF